MPVRISTASIVALVIGMALVRLLVSALQQYSLIRLVVVAIAGPWIIWHGATQIYNAAMHGYVLTGVPERRVYRDKNPRLFRNNVIAWIVAFPMITAGAVIMLLDALQAEHLIR